MGHRWRCLAQLASRGPPHCLYATAVPLVRRTRSTRPRSSRPGAHARPPGRTKVTRCVIELDALAPTLVPGLIRDATARALLPLISTPLLGRCAAGRSLARLHDVSDDQRTWTLHLAGDTSWSDGTPVIAQDCRETLEPCLTSPAKRPQGWLVADAIESVKAHALPGQASQLTFHLRRPIHRFAAWLASEAFAIMPPSIRRGGASTARLESSGAFEFAGSLSDGRGYAFKRRTTMTEPAIALPETVIAVVTGHPDESTSAFDLAQMDLTCPTLHSPRRIEAFSAHARGRQHALRLMGFLLSKQDMQAAARRAIEKHGGFAPGFPLRWCTSFVTPWRAYASPTPDAGTGGVAFIESLSFADFAPNDQVVKALASALGARVLRPRKYPEFMTDIRKGAFDCAYVLTMAPIDDPTAFLRMFAPRAPLARFVPEAASDLLQGVITAADAAATSEESCCILDEFESDNGLGEHVVPVTRTDALYLSRYPKIGYCPMGRLGIDLQGAA
ncbi:hypothetical protein D8B25_20125 [Verminephrobacter aporrectodeae subsp. tuberculatae]|nr:hypothetical protein [Verminephrobacter aporrectodeae subsp. tuberculatae]MCW8205053.1 hypothetical protein [Verminephrobacter aporrectodeae subsp. tuberculatae]